MVWFDVLTDCARAGICEAAHVNSNRYCEDFESYRYEQVHRVAWIEINVWKGFRVEYKFCLFSRSSA